MRKLKTKGKQSGFTIVELLIVIVVIAILAAISVVAYTGVQERANKSAVESDISAIIKKLEITRIDLNRYPEIQSEFPDGIKLSKSAYDTTQNNIYYCYDKTSDRYALGLRLKTLDGYIITDGVVSKYPNVYAATTCGTISKTWVSDATTAIVQGYYGSPSSGWNATWNWTN